MSGDQVSVTETAGNGEEPPKQTEEPTAEKARQIPWLMHLNAFGSEVSVAGLRYVVNESASVFRRSVWVLLLLAGTAFTTYQIVSRIMYYFSYPTNVNILVQHETQMRFPTVTICNENSITLSGARELGKLTENNVTLF